MKFQSFKLNYIDFYDYKIATLLIDGVKMFVVSDLLNQYNQKHNTNKKFKNYLRNEQTKELLMNWPNDTDGSDPSHQCNTVENVDDLVVDQRTTVENADDKAVLWGIPHVSNTSNLVKHLVVWSKDMLFVNNY